MIKHLLGTSIAFVVLTAMFWAVEFFWPGVPGQRRLRRGWLTDAFYWFFTSLVSRSGAQLAILCVLVPMFLLLGRSLDRSAVMAGYGPVLALPKWCQVLLILFAGDVIGYWTHRWFHTRRLWRFHAVHHSSEELDWLSSVRVHPVDEIVSRVIRAVPFVLLGFSPGLIAAYVPFLTFYAIFEHANVSWRLGPLRYVISSPEFHRWHHTKEALGKNFAGLFPVIDWFFGTLYLPADEQPTRFGIRGAPVPESVWGQLLYPFRRRQARPASGIKTPG